MTTIPDTMTAIGIAAPGGPEVLKPETRPVPKPGAGEILVKVKAAGVNRPDVMQRQGRYPPPPGAPDIPGLEIAGEIVAIGQGGTRHKLGDRVCALVPGGGYAEYCAVHETNALPIPDGVSFVEAAGIPETYFTVWTNVFERGGLKAGETFLVHGGTSGIGTTAIMLAKAFGATVMATAGSDEKCAACKKLGADHAFNYQTQDFVAEPRTATAGKGVDLILDMVGGDYVGPQSRRRLGRRAHRADRRAGGSQGDGRSVAHHAEAADPYGLDAARPPRRRQGLDRRGAVEERLAASRTRPLQAGRPRHVPACRGCQGARADGDEPAYRQDRAHPVSPRGIVGEITRCQGRPPRLYSGRSPSFWW